MKPDDAMLGGQCLKLRGMPVMEGSSMSVRTAPERLEIWSRFYQDAGSDFPLGEDLACVSVIVGLNR